MHPHVLCLWQHSSSFAGSQLADGVPKSGFSSTSHRRLRDIFRATANLLKEVSFELSEIDVEVAARSTAASAGNSWAFDGPWSSWALTAFCRRCAAPPNYPTLRLVAGVLQLQRSTPLNLVVFDARGALNLWSARLLPIAFVPSQGTADGLDPVAKPSLSITRPFDGGISMLPLHACAIFSAVGTDSRHGEAIGDHIGPNWTLAVVLDRKNASPWPAASEIFG